MFYSMSGIFYDDSDDDNNDTDNETYQHIMKTYYETYQHIMKRGVIQSADGRILFGCVNPGE